MNEEQAYEKIREIRREQGIDEQEQENPDERPGEKTEVVTEEEKEEEHTEETTEETESEDTDDDINDEEEEIGYVKADKYKALRERDLSTRKLLEEHGFTFKADGTPIPPPADWKKENAPVVTDEVSYFKDDEIAKPAIETDDFKNSLATVESMTASDIRSNQNWYRLAKEMYKQLSDDDFDSWTDKDWLDLRDRYISNVKQQAENEASEYRNNVSAISQITEHRNAAKAEEVFKRYPDAVKVLDEVVLAAKGENMSPKLIASRFEELKDFAIGRYMRQNFKKVLADYENGIREAVEKANEDAAANRRPVGSGTTRARRDPQVETKYTPEILAKAKRAGMDPKEFVELSGDHYTFK